MLDVLGGRQVIMSRESYVHSQVPSLFESLEQLLRSFLLHFHAGADLERQSIVGAQANGSADVWLKLVMSNLIRQYLSKRV